MWHTTARAALRVGAALACFLAIFLTVIDVQVSRPTFYAAQYDRLDLGATTLMARQDYVDGSMQLVRYVRGEVDSIQRMVTVDGQQVLLYNQREMDHMVDVRELYVRAMRVRAAAGVVAVGALVWLVGRWGSGQRRAMLRTFGHVTAAIAVGLAALCAAAVVDFDAFWAAFHGVFFSNDLWLLDPATDRMIRMFPAPFFEALVARVVVGFVVLYGGVWLGLIGLARRGRGAAGGAG